jgi:hypothetical protein
MEHLFSSLQNINGKHKTLQEKIQNGVLHPFHKMSTFKYNLDNNGWNLKHHRDFLESD